MKKFVVKFGHLIGGFMVGLSIQPTHLMVLGDKLLDFIVLFPIGVLFVVASWYYKFGCNENHFQKTI